MSSCEAPHFLSSDFSVEVPGEVGVQRGMAWYDHFTSVDTETTGLGESARIIEVGVVHFYKGAVVREWSALIHPNGVDWEDSNVKKAMEVNRITFAEIQGKPLFEDIRMELMQELTEEVWVAHNTPFDMRMIGQELKRLGENFPYQPDLILDTMSLDNHLNPLAGKRRLVEVAPRWGVTFEDAHRAVVDARTCGLVLAAMARAGKLPEDPKEMAELQKTATATWDYKTRNLRRAG